ncbi:hypothetical protein BDV12DRAFT_208549 [Aspergillus spectabilis]
MARWKNSGTDRDNGFLRKTFEVPNQRWGMKALVSKIKKMKASDLDDIMVIGIDFGTTYSGHGPEEGKAPTERFYEYDKVMWGYDIPSDAEPVKWFKLLLLRDEDLDPKLRASEFVLRGRKMLRELDMSATDVIADYLRVLWQHIMVTIHKARSKSVIGALAFHVVITVPAIWKDYARQQMEEAARRAGILESRLAGPTTLTFAPEPEAAALATLCERARDIKKDDVYVICDAGGGTVDLISYKVGEKDPIELHDAVLGTGGLCGGIFIDEAFETICKNRLGRQWSNLSQAGIKEVMKGEWEYYIKPQYTPKDENKEWIVAIPAEAFKGPAINDESRRPFIKNGRIYFASSDIQKAYNRVFSDIEELIDSQITKAKETRLSGIILVGGLGSSPYLYDHLESTRTAICRGAIFKGFLDGPSVTETVIKPSLGVEYSPIFEEGVHKKKDKYLDSEEGVWRAKDQMEWYLKKGDNVSKAEPVWHTFYTSFDSEDDFGGSYEPPKRCESNVTELCRISINFDSEGITFDELDKYTAENGNKLSKFKYDIELVPSGASNVFALYWKGRRLGSETAVVEF